jgi:hypothetical protein
MSPPSAAPKCGMKCDPVNQATCTVIAQVLPVFLLLVTLQGVYIRVGGDTPWFRFGALLIVIMLILGEVAAVVGAGQRDGLGRAAAFTVWASFGICLFYFLVEAFFAIYAIGRPDRVTSDGENPDSLGRCRLNHAVCGRPKRPTAPGRVIEMRVRTSK